MNITHRESRHLGNTHAGKLHGARLRVESGASAGCARFVDVFIQVWLSKALLAPTVFVIANGVIQADALRLV